MLTLFFLLIAAAPATEPTSAARALDALTAVPAGSVASKYEGLVDDRTFLRRVWLDLAGRLPDPARVDAFMASGKRGKRSLEIDYLLASEMFTERWTTFFADIFQNFAILQPFATYRNAFQQQLRQMVAQNMPWDEMARRILTGTGRGDSADTAMFFWTREAVEEAYRLDYLDDQAAWICDTMLGVQVLCISCHDGAGHLERVNVGLTSRTREQFWGLAAFLASTYHYFPASLDGESEEETVFSRLELIDLDRASFPVQKYRLIPTLKESDIDLNDEPTYDGLYHASSRPGQGMRSPRTGGVVAPVYPFTGETPLPGESRRVALARILTADRQFARNMVNRIWANFFGRGFVEPLNGWDLARLDVASAQAAGSTVQPEDGELLEFLTDFFIDSGYDTRALIRLVVASSLYQWDYAAVEKGQGDDEDLTAWRDNRRVRRIEAEAILDTINQLLGLQPKYVVTGQLDHVVTSAWQLPDPSEPSDFALIYLLSDENGEIDPNRDLSYLGFQSVQELLFYAGNAQTLLAGFGRGDYFNGVARNSDDSIQNSLLLQNGFLNNYWLEQPFLSPVITTLASDLNRGALSKRELVDRLYLNILFRYPTSEEAEATLDHIAGLAAGEAVADTFWMIFNHPDFLYK